MFPARVRFPAGEMVLLEEKNCRFPLVPSVVETSVRVPPVPDPPLTIEFPPSVTIVLPKVVVLPAAPMARVPATPPIFKVVAVSLNRFAVV